VIQKRGALRAQKAMPLLNSLVISIRRRETLGKGTSVGFVLGLLDVDWKQW